MLTRFRRNVKIYFCFQLAYIVPKRPEAVLKASVLIKKKGKTVSYVILASSHRLGNPSGPVREEILVQFMWKKGSFVVVTGPQCSYGNFCLRYAASCPGQASQCLYEERLSLLPARVTLPAEARQLVHPSCLDPETTLRHSYKRLFIFYDDTRKGRKS